MSILMMLALGGKKPLLPFSQVFTANGTWPCPAGLSMANISGYGARGTNGSPATPYYYEVTDTYGIRRSDGAQILLNTRRVFRTGTPPGSGYCDPPVPVSPSDSNFPTYSSYIICYGYEGSGVLPAEPPTTGASSRGLGKVMPGSTGNTTPATTTFENVPVTGSTNYSIVVPSGGRVTISWMA